MLYIIIITGHATFNLKSFNSINIKLNWEDNHYVSNIYDAN